MLYLFETVMLYSNPFNMEDNVGIVCIIAILVLVFPVLIFFIKNI